MAQYLDPKNDITFKKIFGEHPDLAISFLNALLPVEGRSTIENIEYTSKTTPLGVISAIAICCTDNNKKQFIVDFETYANKAHNQWLTFSTLGQSPSYLPVYGLAILDNYMHPEDDRVDFYHTYRFACTDNSKITLDGMTFVVIEMPKFTPESENLEKLKDPAKLWLRFLNEVNENTTVVDKELLKNKLIRKAVELCERDTFTQEELDAYDKFRNLINIDKEKIYTKD
jgi:hypothetical protein